MKKLATATAIILVLSLVLTSLTAFAAPATYSDYADIIDAVAAATEGDTVEIICSGDIFYDYEAIDIPEGVTIKLSASSEGATLDELDICGSGKLELDMTNLTIYRYFYLSGNVEAVINGDVCSLYVYDDVNVTVNGSIKPKAQTYDFNSDEMFWYGGSAALYASGNTTVKINGDVFGEDMTINLDGEQTDYISYIGGDAVSVSSDANVEIIGNVTGGTLTVKFTEDFILSDELGFNIIAGDGISANLIGGKLTVGGNVVGGKAVADFAAYGGAGLYAGSSSVIKIAGDVVGGDSISEDGEGGAGFILSPAMNEEPIISSYDEGEEVEPELPKGDIYVAGTVINGKCTSGKDGAVFIPEGFFFGKIGDDAAAEMTDVESSIFTICLSWSL